MQQDKRFGPMFTASVPLFVAENGDVFTDRWHAPRRCFLQQQQLLR